MYRAGNTQSEIAAKLGTTQKVIWKLMMRHSIATRVAAKRDQRGSKNHMWRGGSASYKAFHQRMYKLCGNPKHCELCGAKGPGRSYDWACMTGRLDDPTDYKRLCRSCHCKHDMKHKNLGKWSQKKEVPNA